MAFESRRLRVQLACARTGSGPHLRILPKTIRETICVEPTPTILACAANHTCFQFRSCALGTCGHRSPILECRPAGTEPCFGSPVVDTPETPWAQGTIPVEVDPEDPDAVLLRPEHLPRLRGQLQMELAQIDELAHRKGEIESQLEDLDSAERQLKEQSGEQ